MCPIVSFFSGFSLAGRVWAAPKLALLPPRWLFSVNWFRHGASCALGSAVQGRACCGLRRMISLALVLPFAARLTIKVTEVGRETQDGSL